jgi:hypothetical protein
MAKKVIPLLNTNTMVLIQGTSGECEQLLCSECKVPCPCCEETLVTGYSTFPTLSQFMTKFVEMLFNTI